MIKRYGESAKANVNYTRRPGVYAILVRRDEILLTHQSAPEPEFQLPGGGIDPGENPIPALHREIYEETGWSAHIERRLGTFRRFTYMPEYDLWAEKICHIYLGRPTLQIGQPIEANHQAIWTSIDGASQLLANSGDRAFLNGYIKLYSR